MVLESLFRFNAIFADIMGILGVIFFAVGLIGVLVGLLARKFSAKLLILLILGFLLMSIFRVPFEIPYLSDWFGRTDPNARPGPLH